MKIMIIGCGGVGSYAIPVLAKMVEPSTLCLIDGDTLEEKNMDRQLFDSADIGKNKAQALAHRYGTEFVPEYFSHGKIPFLQEDLLMVLVDNHPARLEALASCDYYGCRAIFAANETHSAEAYFYQQDWKGGKLDPRIFYPEIVADKSGDPLRIGAGCTGVAQLQNRQLATANFMAASLALHLYVVWMMEAPQLTEEAIPHLPHKLASNLTRLESFKAQ